MRKLLPILIALLLCSFAKGQETGSITGALTDKDNGNSPLPFANVIIKGTTKGTTTDFDGLYTIDNLEAGTYSVEFSFVGYEVKTINNIIVTAGQETKLNAALGASAAVMDEVVVVADVNREKESALLIEQKKAVTIKQSIGAQELARKGVSDAEGAVTKVSGIAKSSGTKNVFVRGLGDRYNSTSLNGLPLPSEDPEYKNISLDFFASDVIKSVGVNKVFNGSLYGDVGGANIDIVSKELSGTKELKLSVGTGYNTNAIGSNFLVPDGTNRLGTGLPEGNPIPNLSSYDFENSFNPDTVSNPIDYSGAISIGKRFEIGDNRLSFFAVGSIDNSYLYREGIIAQYNNAGNKGRDMTSEQSEYTVSSLGMINVDYKFGEGHKISLNHTTINKVTQEVGEFIGENSSVSDQIEFQDFSRRQQTNKNRLHISQLLTEFKLSEKFDLSVKGAYNHINASEPDRRTNNFIRKLEDNEEFFRVTTGSAGLNNRFFSKLRENDFTASAQLDYKFNETEDGEAKNDVLTVGADYRNSLRDFNFRQFSFQFNSQLPVDLNNVDALFNQENLDNGVFTMLTDRGRVDSDFNIFGDVTRPFFYEGTRDIYAGYVQATYDINENLTLSGGLRAESVSQEVAFDTSLLSSVENPNIDPSIIEDTYILPNISAKYNFNENSILRIAGSLSYILPQFKELAPFLYEDVNFSSFGNEGLIASDVLNIDLKYDYFFSSGELISVNGYYKSIKNPINRVRINSAANDLSYVNVGDATVAGVELEFRKKLIRNEISETTTADLQFGLNASYLYSNQKLVDVDTDNLTVRFTESEDQLEGASPLLINTDLTYNYKGKKLGFTTSGVLNYFSDRIFSLGTAGNANFVEESRITLDLVNSITFDKHWKFSFKAKNLLNPDFEITQNILGEDLAVSSYKRGLNFSLGLSYDF